MKETTLSRNTIAFIALANEYCQDIEDSLNNTKEVFLALMLKKLPRIYIAVTDVIKSEHCDDDDQEYICIEPYLTEEDYNSMRNNIYQLLGEDDIYLEVFEEDMKYSDTPITATISENLCDLYQEFYNFIQTIKNSSSELVNEIVYIEKENFESYWGQTLLNVIRAIHNLKFTEHDNDFEI